MDLAFTDEEQAFREEVRAFFAEHVPDDWLLRVRAGLRLEPDELNAYQKALAAKGWGAPTWPVQYGGTGWSPAQLYIFETESARAGAPIQFHQGLELIGPIIFTYGSDALKERYLPGIINADDWWCQGYSEPGAGSDLASLRTSAVRDGDHYVVNGQKMWTSYAQVASHMFMLVRTSQEEKRQQGISLLLVDMNTPGISIRKIETMEEKYTTNEVFLDDVRVPATNLVGEEGRGWEYGKVLLDRERMVCSATAIHLTQTLDAVREAASSRMVGGAPLIEEPGFSAKLAQIEIEAMALETMVLRLLADVAAGVSSGPRGSMVKLRWSDLYQRATALWMEALGPEAAQFRALDPDIDAGPPELPYGMQGALYARVTSIYGGSSEIQHNIIARRALGL